MKLVYAISEDKKTFIIVREYKDDAKLSANFQSLFQKGFNGHNGQSTTGGWAPNNEHIILCTGPAYGFFSGKRRGLKLATIFKLEDNKELDLESIFLDSFNDIECTKMNMAALDEFAAEEIQDGASANPL